MKKAIVLGSSGFIGSRLAGVLRGSFEVCGVDISPGAETEIVGDLLSEEVWKKISGLADVVINCAAIVGVQSDLPESDYFNINTYLPLRMGRYAESAGAHYIHFSTSGIYGFRKNAATEKTPPQPGDIYSLSKNLGELSCIQLLKKKSLLILRLNFPFGPGQQKGLIPKLIHNIASGSPVILNTKDGKPVVSPIWIEDLILLVKLALEKKIHGVYNCGGIEHLSILEISRIIGKHLGKTVNFSLIDKTCLNLMCNSEKLYNDCGYFPLHSIDQALKKTINQHPSGKL